MKLQTKRKGMKTRFENKNVIKNYESYLSCYMHIYIYMYARNNITYIQPPLAPDKKNPPPLGGKKFRITKSKYDSIKIKKK